MAVNHLFGSGRQQGGQKWTNLLLVDLAQKTWAQYYKTVEARHHRVDLRGVIAC